MEKIESELIRREDAIKAVEECLKLLARPRYTVKTAIEAIPSADRPRGEWKPKNHHTDYCSNCGFEETQWRTADYNFCPSCGARMKGVDDEF